MVDASMHLYKRLCLSVGPSVHRSVGLSVRPSVHHAFLKYCGNGVLRTIKHQGTHRISFIHSFIHSCRHSFMQTFIHSFGCIIVWIELVFSRVTEIGLYFAALARNCFKLFPRQLYKILEQKTHKINGGDRYFHR